MEQVPTHGWVPRLLEEITFSETHGRYRDRYTDQAGAFPATGTLGYATALAERHGMEAEEEAKLFRHIGEQISDFLGKHRPERWCQPQLTAKDIHRSFKIGSRKIEVLRGISLELHRGEAVEPSNLPLAGEPASACVPLPNRRPPASRFRVPTLPPPGLSV